MGFHERQIRMAKRASRAKIEESKRRGAQGPVIDAAQVTADEANAKTVLLEVDERHANDPPSAWPPSLTAYLYSGPVMGWPIRGTIANHPPLDERYPGHGFQEITPYAGGASKMRRYSTEADGWTAWESAATTASVESYAYSRAAVDTGLAERVLKGGDAMTGPLTIGVASSLPGHVMRKDEIEQYAYSRAAVDAGLNGRIPLNPAGSGSGTLAALAGVTVGTGGGGALPLLFTGYWKSTTEPSWKFMLGVVDGATPYANEVSGTAMRITNPRSDAVNYFYRTWMV